MNTDDYWKYLGSAAYRKRRAAVLERANKRCERCGIRAGPDSVALEVNHKTYERLGNERLDDLEALCPNCHAEFHHKPVPHLIVSCPQCGERYVGGKQKKRRIWRRRVHCWECMVAFDPRDGTIDSKESAAFREWRLGADVISEAGSQLVIQPRSKPSAAGQLADLNLDDLPPTIPLRSAVELYKEEERAAINSYGWYRDRAARVGEVWLGCMSIPVTKLRNTWTVSSADFWRALQAHRDRVAKIKQATADYAGGILHGQNGEKVETEWGEYRNYGEYHETFSWHDYQRHKSNGRIRRCSHGWRVVPVDADGTYLVDSPSP